MVRCGSPIFGNSHIGSSTAHQMAIAKATEKTMTFQVRRNTTRPHFILGERGTGMAGVCPACFKYSRHCSDALSVSMDAVVRGWKPTQTQRAAIQTVAIKTGTMKRSASRIVRGDADASGTGQCNGSAESAKSTPPAVHENRVDTIQSLTQPEGRRLAVASRIQCPPPHSTGGIIKRLRRSPRDFGLFAGNQSEHEHGRAALPVGGL